MSIKASILLSLELNWESVMRSMLKGRYGLVIFILLIMGIGSRINYDYMQAESLIKSEVQSLNKQISALIFDHAGHIDEKYRVISKIYQHNKKFIELMQNRDRDELFKELTYDYDSMRYLDKHLHVMHLFDANNTTIVRMHKPELYNDNLSDIRPMVKDVNKNRVGASGFEVGKNGITYRVTSPIISKDYRHLGVLEFGVKPSYFIEEIADIIDLEAELLVQSESLKTLSVQKSREHIGEYSAVDVSGVFKEINSKINLNEKYQIMQVGEKTYAVLNNISLMSYSGLNEAKIIFAKDITALVEKYKKSLFMIYSINLLVILSVVIIFFIGLRKTKNLKVSLKELNATLEDKIKQRTEEQNTLLSLFDKGESVLFKWNNDKEWSVDFASLGVTELLGYPLVDIATGKVPYSSCIHKDDLQRVIQEVEEASADSQEYFKHEPYRIITKEGVTKWVYDYTVLVRDESGKITHYIGHISDITEQKNLQEQFLLQSRMAQMGEMISMIAHQWRQPLGTIASTSIDLNMKLELNLFETESAKGREEQEKYFLKSLKQIDAMVQNLTTTIDDFRNFYKVDKSRTTELVDVSLKKAYHIIESSLKANNIEVTEKFFSKRELLVYTNELMQVVLNILQNANDNFISKEIQNPKITIKTFDTNNSVIVEICDNGGGIDEEVIKKIFDPYFSTKHEKNGTGLGLYMSNTIITEHHNGTLSAKNIDGGVCFIFELPLGEIK